MADNLESIPTNELIEKAARTPIEKAIVQLGCILASALTVGSWIAVFWFVTSKLIPGLSFCFLASIVVPYTIFSASKFLAEFRGRGLLRELDRRFGRWNIPAYVRYYKERLGPGEVRCIFSGRGLPHGRRYWGCIEIDDAGMMGLESTASRGLYLGVGADPWSGAERSNRQIASGEGAEIRELIENTKGTGKSQFHPRVRDGFPALVAVIFGDGSETTEVFSNLSGLSDEQQSDDRIRLLRLVAKVVCNRRFGPDEV